MSDQRRIPTNEESTAIAAQACAENLQWRLRKFAKLPGGFDSIKIDMSAGTMTMSLEDMNTFAEAMTDREEAERRIVEVLTNAEKARKQVIGDIEALYLEHHCE